MDLKSILRELKRQNPQASDDELIKIAGQMSQARPTSSQVPDQSAEEAELKRRDPELYNAMKSGQSRVQVAQAPKFRSALTGQPKLDPVKAKVAETMAKADMGMAQKFAQKSGIDLSALESFRGQVADASEADSEQNRKLAMMKAVMAGKDGLLMTGATIRAGANPNSSKFIETLDGFKQDTVKPLAGEYEIEKDIAGMRQKEIENQATREAAAAAREDSRNLQRELANSKLDFQKTESERKGRQADRSFDKKALQDFNNDKQVVKAATMVTQAKVAKQMANSKNPLANGAIPTFLSRASGEVGALTEADKAPFGGSQALDARLQQALEQASTGRLTPENVAFVNDLASLMEKTGNDVIQERKILHAYQYGKSTGSSTDDAMSLYEMPQEQTPTAGGLTREQKIQKLKQLRGQ